MRYGVIECFGLPGAGKTYLSEKISAQLRNQKVRVSNRSSLLAQSDSFRRIMGKITIIIVSLWANRSVIPIAWALVRLYAPHNRRLFLRLLINWLYICAIIRHETRYSDVIVLDQGIGQALWSCAFYGNNTPEGIQVSELLNKLIRTLDMTSMKIFHISADEEQIKSRIHSRIRGRSPLDADLSKWKRAVTATGRTRIILDMLARTTDAVTIVNFDNSETESVIPINIGMLLLVE